MGFRKLFVNVFKVILKLNFKVLFFVVSFNNIGKVLFVSSRFFDGEGFYGISLVVVGKGD